MDKILEFQKICKSFPGVQALKDVDLDLLRGEVHVILGENGAGKSTLMKVLSGAYNTDSGKIIFEGATIEKNSPAISESLGIRMIYQELNLIPELSIQDNIFLGHEMNKGVFCNGRVMYQRTKELLNDMAINEDPRTLIKNLSIATQQMIEITRAISANAKVLVFDEPTSSLTEAEIRLLFQFIQRLKERGVGMFYISHRLEEVFRIGDRVTIMRDGTKISTSQVSELNMEQIIEGIAGRQISNLFPHIPKPVGPCAFEVKNLTGNQFRNINMRVHTGEIIGISGLVGAGRSEIMRACFGIDDYESGEVLIDNKPIPKKNTDKAAQMGLCLLPENRKVEGLALFLSVRENMIISSLKKIFPNRIYKKKIATQQATEYVDRLTIATPTIEKLVNYLSGGTQQKIVVAKWLLSQSRVFIFDEPTRGIDVGAKTDIYELMDKLVESGAAIIMISSDLPEIMGMSDRIYVVHQGAIAGEFEAHEANQNTILQYAFGQSVREAVVI